MAGVIEIVEKEFSTHLSSKRFYILFFIIYFLSLGVAYTTIPNIMNGLTRVGDKAIFLKMFTTAPSDVGISLLQFFSIFGPILGFILTFDAINSEISEGTLHVSLSQPIHRDSLVNGKFLAGVLAIAVFLTVSVFSIVGIGLSAFKMPLPLGELLRIGTFWGLSIVYFALWASLGLLFSIMIRRPSTSALASVAVWLFFSIFIYMFGGVMGRLGISRTILMRLSPPFLYTQASSIILAPKLRFVGPVTMEELIGMVPNPLSFLESLSIIWPQVVSIIAGMLILFLISYWLFMKREIRPT
ncbi:hypothetical protein AKJ37_04180 [candidate division MSBL1 archaeon SCGC-AAA259I09]|uniref:ABC transporter permease n=1 Tax=candidate division MSBL1 archaeon SCGC-AAA259I09 TaxID=1698267 RepID=A0A133URN7_9EURY|nr:hypothetical protein AKJ37_04180 [candidate division MSBL1 archaeon SCGC-AAA259I09]